MSVAKSALIEQFRVHTKDTGSPEVQIALLSERISYLTSHLKVPRKGPRLPSRIDHDGQQAPAAAGLSEPPRPGSVPRDCGTTQFAQVARISCAAILRLLFFQPHQPVFLGDLRELRILQCQVARDRISGRFPLLSLASLDLISFEFLSRAFSRI